MMGTMFMLRDVLTAHFSAWLGRMSILDEVTLPKWLDRRWRVSERRDQRRLMHAERAGEQEPKGKDASTDW
jgi:hypothetical protein